MAKQMNENLGTMAYDGLIVDNVPPAQVEMRGLVTGTETYKRGTLLCKASDDGTYAIYGTTKAEVTYEPAGVLAQDTELDGSENIAAPVYVTGHFDINKLIVKTGSISMSDKEALRKNGIFLDDAVSY